MRNDPIRDNEDDLISNDGRENLRMDNSVIKSKKNKKFQTFPEELLLQLARFDVDNVIFILLTKNVNNFF